MTCTCAKRLLPCPVHKDKHLPFCEDVRVKTYVINVQEAWPVESTDRKDIRYYATVTDDCLRIFKSLEYPAINAAVRDAVNFLFSR